MGCWALTIDKSCGGKFFSLLFPVNPYAKFYDSFDWDRVDDSAP